MNDMMLEINYLHH